jgi:hypothetical protein
LGDLAAKYLEPSDAHAIRQDAAPALHVTAPTAASRAQLGPSFASLSREIRQATVDFDVERSQEEVLAVVARAIRALADGGLRPVLLLDDADGLLRLPGAEPAQRAAAAGEFFTHGLPPLLEQLGVPVLIAAQLDYDRDIPAFRTLALQRLDAGVVLPAPSEFSPTGVRAILQAALVGSGSVRGVDGVFEDDALRTLSSLRYSIRTVRDMISICRVALIEAEAEGRETIAEGDVGYAATQILQG